MTRASASCFETFVVAICGVAIPSLALVVEARTHALAGCGLPDYERDILPTVWHVLAVASIPVAAISGAIDLSKRSSALRALQAGLVGFALGGASLFSLGMLDVLPIALLTMVVGLGILAGAPFFALLAMGFTSRSILTRQGSERTTRFLVAGFVAGCFPVLRAELGIARENERMATLCESADPDNRARAAAALRDDPPDFVALDSRWSGDRAYQRGLFARSVTALAKRPGISAPVEEFLATSSPLDVDSSHWWERLEQWLPERRADGRSPRPWIHVPRIHFLVHGTPYERPIDQTLSIPGDLHEGYGGRSAPADDGPVLTIHSARASAIVAAGPCVATVEWRVRFACDASAHQPGRFWFDLPPGTAVLGFTVLRYSSESCAVIVPRGYGAHFYSSSGGGAGDARLRFDGQQRLEFEWRATSGVAPIEACFEFVVPLDLEAESASLSLPLLSVERGPVPEAHLLLETDSEFLDRASDSARPVRIKDERTHSATSLRDGRQPSSPQPPPPEYRVRRIQGQRWLAPCDDGTGDSVLCEFATPVRREAVFVIDGSRSVRQAVNVVSESLDDLASRSDSRVEFPGLGSAAEGESPESVGGIDAWPAIDRAMSIADCRPRRVVFVCGPQPSLLHDRRDMLRRVAEWPTTSELAILQLVGGPNALRAVLPSGPRTVFDGSGSDLGLPTLLRAAELDGGPERTFRRLTAAECDLDALDAKAAGSAADALTRLFVADALARIEREREFVRPPESVLVDRAARYGLVTEFTDAWLP